MLPQFAKNAILSQSVGMLEVSSFMIALIVLIIINAGVYLYSISSLHARASVLEKYALIPGSVHRGEWYRLVTSAFVHNDIFHIFLNMYSLWILYPIVISVFAVFLPARFILLGFFILYFFSAITSGWLSDMRKQDGVPSVGASGAIFGLLGFLLAFGLGTLLLPKLGIDGGKLVQNILFVLLINFMVGFMPGLNIDNRGHIGGLIGGIIVGIVVVVYCLVGI